MTVHSAKGLEFHAVFISGLEEGLFPHENSLTEQDGLEEERRLMYVALTRARRRLYLTIAQTRMLHGQTRYNIPSRFLEEIPDGADQAGQHHEVFRIRRCEGFDPGYETSADDGNHAYPAGASARACCTPKFGSGVIVSAEGRGADARVQVNFRDAGLKWLALEYAKLDPGLAGISRRIPFGRHGGGHEYVAVAGVDRQHHHRHPQDQADAERNHARPASSDRADHAVDQEWQDVAQAGQHADPHRAKAGLVVEDHQRRREPDRHGQRHEQQRSHQQRQQDAVARLRA